jgi:uncharacterized protein (DUF58 family)
VTVADEDRAPALDPGLLRRLERLAIVARKAVRGLGPGERRAKRHGTSVEFADYRAYSPGDDTRRIDWYAYARLDSLVLKLYQGEQDLALHVLVDQSGSMGAGAPSKLEYARHVAAALAYVGLAAGDRVVVRVVRGGEAPGSLPPLRGKAALRRLLHGLERDHEATGVTSLSAAVQSFVSRRPPIGVVVLVSDLLDPGGVEAPLRGLTSAGHEVHVVHVVSPDEVEPAVGQDVELVDAETGESAAVAMDLPAIRTYRAAWTEWAASVANACRRAEAGYVLARTDVPFETLVLDVLRRRSMVR